jgi:hypothetical protein
MKPLTQDDRERKRDETRVKLQRDEICRIKAAEPNVNKS